MSDHDPVAALYARGAAAWPDVRLDAAQFAEALRRRVDAIAGLHHDIYLAIASAAGDAAASAACDRLCALEVELVAGRLRATPTQAGDLRSELQRLLFTSEPGRAAGIAAYTGRGDLRGYLRVIAARALARRQRAERREVALDDALLDAGTQALDPELGFLRDHYRGDVDAIVRAAVPALPARSRAVLRYHVLDGWSIDQIGALYGVHRATAARWLAGARDELAAKIRAGLAARLAISESQVDSIVALVISRVDLSLERLLDAS